MIILQKGQKDNPVRRSRYVSKSEKKELWSALSNVVIGIDLGIDGIKMEAAP